MMSQTETVESWAEIQIFKWNLMIRYFCHFACNFSYSFNLWEKVRGMKKKKKKKLSQDSRVGWGNYDTG